MDDNTCSSNITSVKEMLQSSLQNADRRELLKMVLDYGTEDEKEKARADLRELFLASKV